MPKPQPVPQTVVCSECGLLWEKHERPTLSECIRLLRAELSVRSMFTIANNTMTGNTTGTVTMLNPPPREIPKSDVG